MNYPKGFAIRADGSDGYGCDSCGDEKIPTILFTNLKKEYLCYFCYYSFGRASEPLTKGTMSQMLNALVKLIEKTK